MKKEFKFMWLKKCPRIYLTPSLFYERLEEPFYEKGSFEIVFVWLKLRIDFVYCQETQELLEFMEIKNDHEWEDKFNAGLIP